MKTSMFFTNAKMPKIKDTGKILVPFIVAVDGVPMFSSLDRNEASKKVAEFQKAVNKPGTLFEGKKVELWEGGVDQK